MTWHESDSPGENIGAEKKHSRQGLTIWLTGLPSAGKTTLGREVVDQLLRTGQRVELLDGDLMRAHLGQGLGFSRQDREENLRRICFVAELLTRNGINVVIAAIAPYSKLRSEFRNRLSPFVEVFVNAPLGVCEQRDVKGLYGRFRKGELKGLTGVDDVYDQPVSPEVECRTDIETVEESVHKIMATIHVRQQQRSSPLRPFRDC